MHFFMTYIPLYRRILILLTFIFASCAHYSTTQQNIKKVNAAFEVKNINPPGPALQKPAPKDEDESSGSIPLSKFLDARTPTVLQSVNPWFSKVQDWSREYVDIAKEERDIRNYILSEKYSTIAVMWADRALQIKNMRTSDAVIKIQLWLNGILLPSLPNTTSFFVAQDAYRKIYDTRSILQNLRHRFCLVSHGVQIVTSIAYLDLSIDLFNQKKYSKSLSKIQTAFASIDSVAVENDKKCDDPMTFDLK